MSEPLLIYTTWPDTESARAFAAEAVEARLAACANILGPMTSVYRWQGAVEQATETPMLLKTTSDVVEALRARPDTPMRPPPSWPFRWRRRPATPPS